MAKVMFFTGVCLSTGGRVSASVHAGMPDPLTRQTPPLHPTRQTPPGPGRTPWTRQTPPPPGSRLQHMVYEWPVRILLECILVLVFELFSYLVLIMCLILAFVHAVVVNVSTILSVNIFFLKFHIKAKL